MTKNITILSVLIQGRQEMDVAANAGKKFQRLVQILDTLRSENGCPWDKEQDEKSIAHYFLEEVYEAVEAISKDDTKTLAEELGDVLMEIVFLARIYKEKEKFTIFDVLEGINQKMIRRHPHVFGRKRLKSLGINPEIALKQTNEKFIQRFKFIEKRLKESGRELGQVSLEEMDKIWEEAKKKIQ